MIQKGFVNWNAGKNLANLISKNLVKDHYTAIVEFVSNSYDADAEKVSIIVNTLDDLLVIEDDGIGMDEIGIQNFYRMGDSEKIDNPLTAKGRQKIGKFGIATVLLEYLADSYVLETWKSGKKIIIEENFNEAMQDTQPKTNMTSYSAKRHGSKITFRDLKINSENFDLERLKQVLEWEVPCLPDFKIFVNNVLVPQRSVVTYSTEYLIDEEVENLGRVHGSIFYTNKNRLKSPGIFIYVNQRAVGNPRSFNDFLSSRMRLKTIGLINADGLEKRIGFDRSRFKDESKEYLAVKNIIVKALNSIRYDLENNFVSSGRYYLSSSSTIPDVIYSLKSAETRLNRTIVKQNNISPIRLELTVSEENWLSKFNKDDSIIYINASNPQLSFFPYMRNSRDVFETKFIMLALSAVTEADLINSRVAQNVFGDLANNTFEAAKELFSEGKSIEKDVSLFMSSDQHEVVPIEKVPLNPYKLYTVSDIGYLTGHHVNTIKYLYISGALKPSDGYHARKFKASDIKESLKKIQDYVPVGRLLSKDEYERRIHKENNKRQTNVQALLNVEFDVMSKRRLPEYVMNVGTSDKPFMFVKKDKIEEFKKFYFGIKK